MVMRDILPKDKGPAGGQYANEGHSHSFSGFITTTSSNTFVSNNSFTVARPSHKVPTR